MALHETGAKAPGSGYAAASPPLALNRVPLPAVTDRNHRQLKLRYSKEARGRTDVAPLSLNAYRNWSAALIEPKNPPYL